MRKVLRGLCAVAFACVLLVPGVGDKAYVEIGNFVNIRECATINRGTKASGKGVTKVGDHTLSLDRKSVV